MTVLEALLAVIIAFGVAASAIEASRLVIGRSAIARLEVEAALDAETLLSRVGNDLPLNPGHLEGVEGNGMRWAIDIVPAGRETDTLQAYQVTSNVAIGRASTSAHSTLATLKIRWAKP
jgi:hypothetical protein